MDPNLIKRARLAIEDLQEEVQRTKQASALAFKLYKSGTILAEDLEEKIASFSTKSKEDLEVFEKAAEIVVSGNSDFSIGKISEPSIHSDNLDRLTRMLLEDEGL